MTVPVITAVELAIVHRLRLGLGKMVRSVETYGGELDDESGEVIRRFPAAWVTFGGVRDARMTSTSQQKWKDEAIFAVMVGARSVRNEQAARHGGAARHEVGTNVLIYAVRRLLAQQDFGLGIRHLVPGKVRTLRHILTSQESFSCFALEFHTAWVEDVLPNGRFPEPVDAGHPDRVFVDYQGKLDAPAPELTSIGLNYHLVPGDDVPDAHDDIRLRSQP
ncbi:DUF1834 family protein [Cupriavidus taiwanensis]|uniref:DUF1834 family protein n=1 Tax=Cupriavidus taiwanensis TaxID=164546 RepID=UPI00254142A1|nr:DUF1834 family protein [Cupriavidus taiwanensis]MDK3025577.1 DUF1834 family protein [Cupriavidus taiwanensis]